MLFFAAREVIAFSIEVISSYLLYIEWHTGQVILCSHNSKLERQQSDRVTTRQSFSPLQIIA